MHKLHTKKKSANTKTHHILHPIVPKFATIIIGNFFLLPDLFERPVSVVTWMWHSGLWTKGDTYVMNSLLHHIGAGVMKCRQCGQRYGVLIWCWHSTLFKLHFRPHLVFPVCLSPLCLIFLLLHNKIATLSSWFIHQATTNTLPTSFSSSFIFALSSSSFSSSASLSTLACS